LSQFANDGSASDGLCARSFAHDRFFDGQDKKENPRSARNPACAYRRQKSLTTVLMCGSENGSETLNTLFSAIRSAQCSAYHIGEESIAAVPPKAQSPDFFVVDNARIKNLHTNGGIALFKKSVPRGARIEIPPAFFAVIDSDNGEAADLLRGDGIQTVTCGLSQKDTLTFSSLENDRAVVSLQRRLTALDGREIEPVELPVLCAPASREYPLLAAVAVLLLTGVRMPKEGLVLQ
jgi:hypothetical protein